MNVWLENYIFSSMRVIFNERDNIFFFFLRDCFSLTSFNYDMAKHFFKIKNEVIKIVIVVKFIMDHYVSKIRSENWCIFLYVSLKTNLHHFVLVKMHDRWYCFKQSFKFLDPVYKQFLAFGCASILFFPILIHQLKKNELPIWLT